MSDVIFTVLLYYLYNSFVLSYSYYFILESTILDSEFYSPETELVIFHHFHSMNLKSLKHYLLN